MTASSHSLVQRLNRALIPPLVLVCLVAAFGSVWHVQAQVGSTLDAALLESAQRLLQIATHELSEHHIPLNELTLSSILPPLPSGPIVENDDLIYQIVSSRGHVLIRSAEAPARAMPVSPADGFFRTADLQVYTLNHPTLPVRIHIVVPQAYRHQVQMTAALLQALPFFLLLPLVTWIVRQVSRRELAPVWGLAQQIRERSEHDLRPVDLSPLPRELASVAESTNYLMQRLDEALDTERALAANAAHELRTPLTTVRLRLQSVLLQPLAAAARDEMRSAVDALDQLSRRTEKLLQLSRAEAGAALSREPVNLGVLAAAVAQEFWMHPGWLDRLHLSVPEEEDLVAQGDFDALAMALRNLLENAARHGGACQICISVEQPATIRVTDDGPGVSTPQLELMRRRHVRHSQDTAGYGLGMSIVTILMERHRGQLELVSPPPGKPHGLQASLVLRPYAPIVDTAVTTTYPG
ncbi:ATP-binding protein [Polaromonas sp.]|uniref:sensor histidine kinase n=1 Tax=Polaromonas sp. TaxID=1869339 RepID=UPI00286BF1D6|nr:ATP-binding protein [Polaromonas sp.]